MDCLYYIEHLCCSYSYSKDSTHIVLDINRLIIPRGKVIFIVGESGIGKSTILELLGMMNNTIVPNSNTKFVFYDNDTCVDLIKMWHNNKDKEMSLFRLKHFNFIFQNTNLMPNFTAYENIAFTRMLQGYTQYSTFNRVKNILSEIGLGHIDDKRMTQELSGGQRQRLAFARAILPDFSVLLADEPTGNLDRENADNLMRLLTEKLKTQTNSSAIIVSHDMRMAVNFADVVIVIKKVADQGLKNENRFYGYIEDSCVYTKNSDGLWNNKIGSYTSEEFEKFLAE